MIPRAKAYKKLKGRLSCSPILFPIGEDGEAAARLLSLFLPALGAEVAPTPHITLLREEQKGGAYRLRVTEDGALIGYGDYEGLRNAIATLASLYTDGGFSCAEITDAPDFSYRSAMLDLARGYVELPVLREHLVRMAFLKYNTVHLHLMDNESYVMESAVVPNPDGHRQYTQDELRELCALCRLLSLEVIPEIEFPTHAANQLKAIPALWCDIIDHEVAMKAATGEGVLAKFLKDGKGVSTWAICIGADSTYEIYRKIIAEIVSVFPGNYIHVGGDEIAYPHLGAVPHWDNCRACRARMEKRGLTDTLALYHDGFLRLHEIISSFGKRMIKWNEGEEMLSPPPLPRDIIFEHWRPRDNTRVADERRMLCDAGFSVINAHYYYAYADFNHYMSAEKLNGWSPANEGEGEAVMGGETCAWELGNPEYAFYAYRLPFSMGLFADRVWNRDSVPYDEGYRAELLRALIGHSGLGDAAMAPLPAILPPIPFGKQDGSVPPTVGQIPSALEALSDIDGEAVYGRLFLDALFRYYTSLLPC